MNCNESLNLYEIEITKATEEFLEKKKKIIKRIDEIKNSNIKIEQEISDLVIFCKKEVFNKSVNIANEELSSFFDAFSISVSKNQYCGDKKFVDTVNIIEELALQKKNNCIHIDQLNLELKHLEDSYNADLNKLTKETQEVYDRHCDTISTKIDLSKGNCKFSTTLPVEICIGNVLRQNTSTFKNISKERVLR